MTYFYQTSVLNNIVLLDWGYFARLIDLKGYLKILYFE